MLQTEKFNIGQVSGRKSLQDGGLDAMKIAHFFAVAGRQASPGDPFGPLAGRLTNTLENARPTDNLTIVTTDVTDGHE